PYPVKWIFGSGALNIINRIVELLTNGATISYARSNGYAVMMDLFNRCDNGSGSSAKGFFQHSLLTRLNDFINVNAPYFNRYIPFPGKLNHGIPGNAG